MSINKVLYNVDQRNDTTAAEKATARANIGAQGALTAGSNITISNGVISAANTEYQAGHGLTLSNNTFAVDDTVLQGKLTAGANIQLNGNTISATDTTYTAGSNVQISSENVISATDTTYTAGSGLALNGTEFSNTAPNVKSDWNAAAGSDAEILNKPTIPTVNDGTLTIQRNGVQVAQFTANQSSAATANIAVPTDTSDLTNGAGFITSAQVPAQVNADWDATSGAAEILHKPTIPTVNDGTLTIQRNGTNVATFSSNQSNNATANISVPTDTSDLTNGAGYITASQVPGQVNADWNSTSGASEILNKPTIPTVNDGTLTIQVNGTQLATFSANQSSNVTANITSGGADIVTRTNGQGGYIEHPVSKLTLDTDFQQILTDGTEVGVYAPTPVVAVTDKVLTVTAGSDVPLWLDRPNLPTVEYIQFNYSNTTTAQDDVYAAIAAAYTNGKLPVLTCTVAGGALYWFPTATGQASYAFARNTSNTCCTAEFDHTLHVLTLSQKSIVDYTAGTNISIDANHQISATDTTYSAGSYININSNNVISNTMHQNTAGLMISYNTLGNSGTTNHTWGPWRLQVTKKAMVTWDDGTGTNPSVLVQVAHSDYISGTITNGRVQHVNYYPWRDGVMDQVYTGHVQWAFTGAYAQGGSNDGFPIDLTSPLDPDGNARACPRSMRALHLIYNCGIDSPDWLDLTVEPLYVNNNTSLTSNAARLLIRAKYFYV